MKYLIVLFKNKERKKIIKKFKTFENAKKFYDKMIKENTIVFNKEVENGKDCFFELGLMEKDSSNFESYFIKDSLGRQVKVDLDDPEYKLISVSDYLVEELIYDIQKNEKIGFEKFIKTYLPKNKIRLISKLNNKVIVQDDDLVYLFSLKSDSDCARFLRILQNYMFANNLTQSLIVFDTSKPQKKYLYGLLKEKGVDVSILYRKSTTYFKK
jgi:hypothetical protein